MYRMGKKTTTKEVKKLFIDEKTKPILEILKRVRASAYIKNAFPLSCLIVAPVGAGKTTALRKISSNNGVMAFSDFTPYGLTKCLPEIRMKNIKHIIIYDLVEPMSRSRSIVGNLIGFLNSLIEEGVFKISTGFIEIKEPLQLGLITCTTPTEIKDKRRDWLGIGFISRLLPISYNISKTDVIQILEDMADKNIREFITENQNLKEIEIEGDKEIFLKLIPYSQNMSFDNSMPFRKLNQLQVLLMSNALIEGRKKVNEKDFEWFKEVVKYLNYEMNNL